MTVSEQALNEIEAILKKYDLGGFITVHDKDGGDFRPFFPTWSEVTFQDKGKCGLKIRMRTKITAEATLGMLFSMRTITLRAAAIFEKVGIAFAEHLDMDLVKFLDGLDNLQDEDEDEDEDEDTDVSDGTTGTVVPFPKKDGNNPTRH